MVENYLKEHGDVAEGRKAVDAMHPLGHVGEPDDIAYGVVYLASDESKFVAGSGTRYRRRIYRAVTGGMRLSQCATMMAATRAASPA